MWSEQSKREWKRRQYEQIQLANERIRELTTWLAAGDYRHMVHRHRLPNGKLGAYLTDDEMRAYMLERLEEMREHLARWSEPASFDRSSETVIPKSVARAMNRLRKRTRLMLKQKKG